MSLLGFVILPFPSLFLVASILTNERINCFFFCFCFYPCSILLLRPSTFKFCCIVCMFVCLSLPTPQNILPSFYSTYVTLTSLHPPSLPPIQALLPQMRLLLSKADLALMALTACWTNSRPLASFNQSCTVLPDKPYLYITT